MTRPNILPGKREVSFSHGHAHIKRDGDIFATVTLGRDGRGMHAEGIHLAIANEAQAIASVPALLEALEKIHIGACESPWINRIAKNALIAAGYQF